MKNLVNHHKWEKKFLERSCIVESKIILHFKYPRFTNQQKTLGKKTSTAKHLCRLIRIIDRFYQQDFVFSPTMSCHLYYLSRLLPLSTHKKS